MRGGRKSDGERGGRKGEEEPEARRRPQTDVEKRVVNGSYVCERFFGEWATPSVDTLRTGGHGGVGAFWGGRCEGERRGEELAGNSAAGGRGAVTEEEEEELSRLREGDGGGAGGRSRSGGGGQAVTEGEDEEEELSRLLRKAGIRDWEDEGVDVTGVRP